MSTDVDASVKIVGNSLSSTKQPSKNQGKANNPKHKSSNLQDLSHIWLPASKSNARDNLEVQQRLRVHQKMRERCVGRKPVDYTIPRRRMGFNLFLDASIEKSKSMTIPNELDKLRCKTKASDDLDEEAINNVLDLENRKLTQGERDILRCRIHNRSDREAIRHTARLKTLLRLMDDMEN